MKGNQYSVKIYEVEIDDEMKFMAFFDANYILFKEHLIAIQGELSPTIESYLKKKSLKYIHNVTLPTKRRNRSVRKTLEEELKSEKIQNIAAQKMAKSKLAALSNRLANNLTVLDGIIRSGRELNIEGDLLLLNRVNSGATINTSGSLIVTKVVEGAIRCNGNFMMLAASPKANIVFHGVEVDNTLLEDRLNRVDLKNNKIIITPVLKKEINWA